MKWVIVIVLINFIGNVLFIYFIWFWLKEYVFCYIFGFVIIMIWFGILCVCMVVFVWFFKKYLFVIVVFVEGIVVEF